MISVDCTCGKTLKFRDTAAGRKSKCRHCGSTVSIPENVDAAAPDEPDFLSTIESAVGMIEGSASVSLDLAARQIQKSGDVVRSLAPCPGCGSKVPRTADCCKDCHLSFRTGRCASCGAAVDMRTKRDARNPGNCQCEALPVIWGNYEHNGLCINCGRTCSMIPSRLSRFGTNSSPADQLSCPWCAADSAIDSFDSARSSTQTDLWYSDLTSNRQSKRRTDYVRLQKLDQMIETLKPRLREAAQQQRQLQAGNMVGSMFSAVLWGTLLGNPSAGVAAASVSKSARDGQILEETGVQRLQKLLATATMARKRLATASGYEDPVKPTPWKTMAICVAALVIVILAMLIASAVSS